MVCCALVRSVLREPLVHFLLLALMLLVPARAQGQTDISSLVPHAGRAVTAIKVTGQQVTREYLIRREIQTQTGTPLVPDTVAADLQRLENLSIFAQVQVQAVPDGEGVRLVFHIEEMPAVIP